MAGKASGLGLLGKRGDMAQSEHVCFFEPRYTARTQDLWNIRGGYKYGSIVGRLQDKAKISVLMSSVPPRSDPHVPKLQSDFGISVRSFVSADNPEPSMADELASNLADAIVDMGATIISNLNGRGVGYHYAMARAAKMTGIRYVMRVAGNDIESRAKVAEDRNQPFYGTERLIGSMRQERVAAHLADSIIVMNNRERARVAALTSHSDRINVCFRGVDQGHFYPNPKPSQSCRRFLFVGRQSYEKGYDILEAASDRLSDQADVSVSFAGTFTPGRRGIRNYLGFVGYAQLPEVYRAHDALVLCSRTEGFPQVIMEAMSCGLPCIVTRHLFEHEFRDGVNCLFVEPEAESVAAAMERLQADDTLFQSLRREALAVAKAEYSEVVNQGVYHKILLAR